MGRGGRLDSRHEAPLPMRDQSPQNGLDLVCRLALAEDHLGKPAANPAVEVDLGKSPGIDIRLGADPHAASAVDSAPAATASSKCVSSSWSMSLGILPELAPRDRLAY